MPKIAVTQMECAVGDVDANVSKAEGLISEAPDPGRPPPSNT